VIKPDEYVITVPAGEPRKTFIEMLLWVDDQLREYLQENADHRPDGPTLAALVRQIVAENYDSAAAGIFVTRRRLLMYLMLYAD
jgi:hypothetical protein